METSRSRSLCGQGDSPDCASDEEETVAVKNTTKKAGRKARSKPKGKALEGYQEANLKSAEDDMCLIGESEISFHPGL